MQEQERYALATTAAETRVLLWELEDQQGACNLDAMMRRLKDLAAYSLSHAEILYQREGVELLALALFFGTTSNPRFYPNQQRLAQLAPDSYVYPGQAEHIEREIALRRPRTQMSPDNDHTGLHQLQLL